MTRWCGSTRIPARSPRPSASAMARRPCWPRRPRCGSPTPATAPSCGSIRAQAPSPRRFTSAAARQRSCPPPAGCGSRSRPRPPPPPVTRRHRALHHAGRLPVSGPGAGARPLYRGGLVRDLRQPGDLPGQAGTGRIADRPGGRRGGPDPHRRRQDVHASRSGPASASRRPRTRRSPRRRSRRPSSAWPTRRLSSPSASAFSGVVGYHDYVTGKRARAQRGGRARRHAHDHAVAAGRFLPRQPRGRCGVRRPARHASRHGRPGRHPVGGPVLRRVVHHHASS